MCFGVARWSLGGTRWSLGAARGCLVVTGHKMKLLESLGKGVFGPLAPRGGVGGILSPF